MEICANNIMLIKWQSLRLTVTLAVVTELLGDLMSLISDTIDARVKSSSVSAVELHDIRDSLNGDSNAYKRIVEKHQKHISQIMWRFSRDNRVHEDLIQDVFVEAYLSLKTYKAKAPFENWLARIATRVGYQYWRQNQKKQNTESFSLEDWDMIEQQANESSDPSVAAELLYQLLGKLPPRDRLVLTVRFLEQCSIEETAQRMGWSESMVKVQTYRAKNKLKKLFHKIGKDIEL